MEFRRVLLRSQRLSEFMIDIEGVSGVRWDEQATRKEDWATSWLTAPTGRIAGGVDEMLLNTIAERILGLPQDHRPDKGVPFNEIPGCPAQRLPPAHSRVSPSWPYFSLCA